MGLINRNWKTLTVTQQKDFCRRLAIGTPYNALTLEKILHEYEPVMYGCTVNGSAKAFINRTALRYLFTVAWGADWVDKS